MVSSCRVAILLFVVGACGNALADKEVPCPFVSSAPVMDGLGTDTAWSEAPMVSVRDGILARAGHRKQRRNHRERGRVGRSPVP